jgi:hypothetical protein
MAASTITRTTWTNDTGTPSVPVGDGTIINNARLQEIYAAIDQMLAGAGSYATLSLGGLLAVEGFGTHNFSAGGSGTNQVAIRNTSAGTANLAGVLVGNNGTVSALAMWAFSTTYTSTGLYLADGCVLESTRAGGLGIAATDASGVLRFHAGGPAERMRLDASGRLGLGTTSPAAGGLTIAAGAITSGSALGALNPLHLVIGGGGTTPQAGMVAWGDGTGYNLDFGTRSGGNFSARYRMTDSGQMQFSDGSVGTPSISFINDANSGWYRTGSGDISYAADGVRVLRLSGVAGASAGFLGLLSTANGTGSASGNSVLVGRNTSGNGAVGTIGLVLRNGLSERYLYPDASGDLRIHTAPPTEDNTTVAESAGTIVGTQTSARATKQHIADYTAYDDALALMARTPLFSFRYREGGDIDTHHVGILAEESPEFARYQQTTFDPVNAFGYTAAAIKALLARVESLEAARG